ncbi:prolyl oligopeptidase family serine peptidase, partial [Candidatus Sumerlaeota bacterium]|nr:prolyl oligopeptidase family serine peptidase [Candidatus Sumerlaeota bacterium]
INPQLPAGKVTPDLAKAWQKAEPDILMILNEVRSQYRVDDSRIYLTGLSLGGFGTYLIAADHPELFAACAPLCGGCDPTRAVEFKGMPFWIFHGEKDPVVSANFSKNMYQAMKSAGCDVQLTLYPEALHDCWSETYQNAQLYSWFLSHKLRGR